MEIRSRTQFAEKVKDFHLPKYHELPTIGLYLDQVTQYINNYIMPIGCPEITPSMVSNYVKQGIIATPIKKQYPPDSVAYLIFVSILKNVLSIEFMGKLFEKQKQIYSVQMAYDYCCSELENALQYICGLKDELDTIGVTNTELKDVLRSAVIASANILYVNNSIDSLTQK